MPALASQQVLQLRCHDAVERNIVTLCCQFEIKSPIALAMGQENLPIYASLSKSCPALDVTRSSDRIVHQGIERGIVDAYIVIFDPRAAGK